ncbi:4-hydroxy-tetrahydrodipicolinate synthase [Chitinivorax sp. B]|uniref:4-hydroxy-tetrahydrodipicolinate synthase n=1 Tax=Chitinivorax sp. B TaxID=2502235 RepID=UPI0010F97C66|nr:4-hydroxy-tetrahydrodipicolinate synthase [Chitinivorax sp. B]
MRALEGIWVPMITPFQHGHLDLDAAVSVVKHLLAGGVHGIIVCGTTGEAATLSTDEKHLLLKTVIETVAGRAGVAMGVAGNDTQTVVADVVALTGFALDALLVSAPYYVRPAQEGIRLHFEAVAAATTLPIIIYNIPYRTGVNIEVGTLKQLARNPQFAAIKESGAGNMPQMMDIIGETPLKVLSGEDNLIFPLLALGGHGAIAAAAHIHPELYVEQYQAVQQGNYDLARALHFALRPLVKALFSEPNPGPVKAALAMQGLIQDELRLPMTTVTEACRERISAALGELDKALANLPVSN